MKRHLIPLSMKLIHVSYNNSNLYLPSAVVIAQVRASDNSQEKKSNFAGFLETNSRRKGPISREFRGNFRGKFRRQTKKKAKKKDSRKKKIYWKDVKFRARKLENTKVHPTQFSRQLFLFRATRKT